MELRHYIDVLTNWKWYQPTSTTIAITHSTTRKDQIKVLTT